MTATSRPPLYQGVFTPHAQVLCLGCDGRVSRVVDAPTEREAETTCDSCHARIAARADAAHEHELALALRRAGFRAGMNQTGGLCSNAAIVVDPKSGASIVYTHDEDSRPSEAAYVVFVFDDDEDELGRPIIGVDGSVGDWNPSVPVVAFKLEEVIQVTGALLKRWRETSKW